MAKITHAIKPPGKPLKNRNYRIIGLMSGTSMDGIDVALLETDGKDKVKRLGFLSFPYPAPFRRRLMNELGKMRADKKVERDLTGLHAFAVLTFMKKHKLKPKDIDALGFHGHTLFHAPHKKFTVQAGDGKLLSKLTGIPVIHDFRSDDMKAGGQGAPLVPVYHRALSATLKKPVVFLNSGGVANITFIGKDTLLAFDTGPGNAMIDDWMRERTKKDFDKDGKTAAKGRTDKAWVQRFLKHGYFKKRAPKSLDREAFKKLMPRHLGLADGAATLTAMSVEAIVAGLKSLPQKPLQIIVAGGGRKNAEMMRLLAARSGIKVVPIERAGDGLNGDAIEAEAFAYIAARIILGLPYSFAGTTGRKAA